jgi:glyoxylase-like metal-dependent hydrolase (beta-lactamase superfamily II)
VSLFAAAMLTTAPCAYSQSVATSPASIPAPIEYFKLFPGFVGEIKNEEGWTTAFAAANPWGQYTAYLMSTNAKGQRTIRIEQYFPYPRAEGRGLQGTTMYLLEGRDRALLIDTGNPATATDNVNDLKTVVRHLLAHESDGSFRAKPLDFVVANTHSHGDHTGQNFRMWDRPFYYMDLDWPALAPANYVPIREGGGPTKNGSGTAVAEIELGDRKITTIALPPHTAGSTGYLDADNQMLFSGDALGSAFVWVQGGPITRYLESTRRLAELTAAYPRLVIFGAHFYQYALGPRREAPINGRPGDRQYILDQAELAEGLLSGKIVGEVYEVGRDLVWVTLRSAQIVYSLATLYPAGTTPSAPYHAVRIPSSYPEKWQITPAQKTALGIKAELYLIRGPMGEVFHALKGSKKTLLIGSGSGAPGLNALVRQLVGNGPLEVALTDGDPDQAGGLAQLSATRVYAPAGAIKGWRTTPLKTGDVIDLGLDKAGRPLRLEVQRFGASSVTLLDVNDRILFVGNTLGVQGADSGWTPPGGAARYKAALSQWRAGTDGRYDILYTARNHQWLTSPSYVDQLGQALDKVIAGGAPMADSKIKPGLKLVKSDGSVDVVASVGVTAK